MDIGVQDETSGEEVQHAGYRFGVHTNLYGSSECQPFEDSLQHIVDTVQGDRSTVGRGEHIGVIDLALLLLPEFDCLRRNA